MNRIQEQVVKVFEFPIKYEMFKEDAILLKNAVQMLVNALNIIQNHNLINELTELNKKS